MKFSITFVLAVLPLFVSAAPPSAAYSKRQAQNAQTSLTLDKSVIADSFKLTGQEQPTAGQSPSLTSTNNFINFCALTLPNKPITNGLQTKTGSCNPVPMGVIAATTNMPSAKFQFPANGGTVAPNQAFTVRLAVKNIQLGTFTNAQTKYYAAPQQVNAQGNIIGHTHVTIEKMTSLDQTTPTDPNVFAFFKGVNNPQDGSGVVTVDVTAGLPAGAYRMCTINSSANHQPVLVAVAQHGHLDDCIYFTAGGNGNGQNNGQNNNNNQNNGQNNNQNNGQNKAQQQNGQNRGGRFGQNNRRRLNIWSRDTN